MGLKLTLSIQSIKKSKNNIKEELFYELERFIYRTTNKMVISLPPNI